MIWYSGWGPGERLLVECTDAGTLIWTSIGAKLVLGRGRLKILETRLSWPKFSMTCTCASVMLAFYCALQMSLWRWKVLCGVPLHVEVQRRSVHDPATVMLLAIAESTKITNWLLLNTFS
jgi:hypothetical protein